MKCKILEKASVMFLTFGFKSVTMDDISSALGISKKTVYSHFKNKNKLVEEATLHLFNRVCDGINLICNKKQNSIVELFEIKNFIFKNLNDEKSSPQYQLQKFFPEIHDKIKKKKLEVMHGCVEENLTRGILEGVYRNDLNIEFTTRIYFTGLNGIKDLDIFPDEMYDKKKLMIDFLDYHIRAISTPKGLVTLDNIINNN